MQDEQLRRLNWQCRRGLLELDILFNRFLEHEYCSLNQEEKEMFQRLLEEQDQTLLAWFQDQQEPPSQLKQIIAKVK